MNSIKTNLKQLYTEFLNWKETIEDCVSAIQKVCPQIKSIDDIPYEQIRTTEMLMKVARWKEMEKAGMELTPGQKVLVADDKEKQVKDPKPQI